MATPVLMPRQGNTVEECLLASWKKKKGDIVTKGESLADIETDKATFELEAPEDGILLEIFAEPGTLVPVMTNIAVIGRAGESTAEFKPVAAKQATSEKAVVTAAESAAPVQTASSVTAAPATAPAATVFGELSPRAQSYLESHNLPVLPKSGSGPNGRILEEDLRKSFLTGPRVSSTASVYLKEGWRAPATGSGPADLILKSDLLPPGKPLSGIRSIIASRMKESLAKTAQYTVSMKASAGALLTLRKKIKPLAESGKLTDISINDLV
ncbi:MAG: 2-oxo acid dehydrogenase subunit E2, partial [Fibrobacteres bacterium]|nr:2-oxo acid dehydrogenase subunit E2 [Fibrobacterota bacterium]